MSLKAINISTKQNSSLKKELRIWFLLLALVPLVLISLLNYSQSSKSLLNAAESELKHSAALSKRFIENWIYYRFIDINNLAESNSTVNFMRELNQAWQEDEQPLQDFVASYPWTEISEVMQTDINTFHKKYDYVYDILLINPKGDVVFSLIQESDLGTNIFSGDAAKSKLAASAQRTVFSGQTMFSDMERYTPSNNALANFVTAPVYDEQGSKIGVMIVQLKLERIFDMLATSMSNASTLRHYLIAEDGYLRSPYEMKNIDDVLKRRIESEQFQLWKAEHGIKSKNDVDAVEKAFEYRGPNGQLVIGLHQAITLGNQTWGLISEIDHDEAFTASNTIAKTTLVFFIITALTVFFISMGIAKRITNPLIKLANHSLAIAEGKGEKAVKIHSKNEIGQLAKAFNYMVSNRQGHIEQLNASNAEAQNALLALNEQKYALDQHSIVAITDLKGTITFANQKFSDISGYEIEELVGQNHRILNSGHHPKFFWKQMYKTLSKGDVFHEEIKNVAKDGSVYWLDTTIIPFVGESGRVKNYIAIRTDITQRKITEMAFEQKSKQLALVVESTNVGIWDWKISTGEIRCNQRWFEIIGQPFPATGIINKTDWESRIHPEDLEKTQVEINNHFEDDTVPFSCESRLKHTDNNWVWVGDSGKVVERDEDGKPVRMIGTLLDITPLKTVQLEHELSVQLAQLKLEVAEALSTPSRLKVKLNNALRAIQKISQDNFSGSCAIGLTNESNSAIDLAAHVGEYTEREVRENLQRAEDNGSLRNALLMAKPTLIDTQIDTENDIPLRDLQFAFPIVTIVAKHKKILGLLLIQASSKTLPDETTINLFDEITHMLSTAILQERTRSLLKKASFAAEQNSRLKSEFLASMSHEIRTPMNGVLGMLGLLLNSGLNDDQRHKAQIANSSAESLLVLINDILDFSKIEAGKLELELIDFNLRGMLGDFAEAMALRAQDKGLEIVLDVQHIKQSFVKGDRGRIRQILTNLVGNAIKFTHQGEIVITARTEPVTNAKMKFTAEISDTGIGIPESKIRTLFETFTQVDASTTREYGGTGLGLSICKSLCELMQGKISVSSSLGNGSTFKIEFIIETSNKAQPVIPTIDIKSLDLLIVDDNATNREVLRGQLEMWGAEVTEADSAKQALSLCEKRLKDTDKRFFDVAFLDMQMPEIDGVALGKMFKEHPSFCKMKLVMMTSISQGNEAEFFSQLGFSAYFPKPATTSDLFNTLAIVVDDGEALRHVPIITHNYLQTFATNPQIEPKKLDYSWPSNTKLLLVEDNRINQQVALGMLAELGLSADVAVNGKVALTYLQSAASNQPYTLILMDCQMPVMDGYQTTREIRTGNGGKRYNAIPIVAMTANAMEGDREKCTDAGMNDYLAKPIELDTIQSKLMTWLNPNHSKVAKVKAALEEKSAVAADDLSKPTTISEVSSKKPANTEETTVQAINDESKEESLVIDKAAVLKRVSGKKPLLKMLITNFMEDYPYHLSSLQSAKENGDYKQLHLSAHTFKGMTANLGGIRVVEKSLQVETAAKQESKENIEDSFEDLVKELEVFTYELKHFAEKISE